MSLDGLHLQSWWLSLSQSKRWVIDMSHLCALGHSQRILTLCNSLIFIKIYEFWLKTIKNRVILWFKISSHSQKSCDDPGFNLKIWISRILKLEFRFKVMPILAFVVWAIQIFLFGFLVWHRSPSCQHLVQFSLHSDCAAWEVLKIRSKWTRERNRS